MMATNVLLAIGGMVASLTPEIPVSEIAAYKAALSRPGESAATAVRFRDLWEHPDAFRGRQVRGEGTLRRKFTAPASGELPARVEMWVATDSGDLICLVFPAGRDLEKHLVNSARLGFQGTSLGVIDYESGDVLRRAPLVVGSEQPQAIPPIRRASTARGDSGEWLLAAACMGFVLMMIGRVAVRRPTRSRPDASAPMEFES